MTRPSIGTPAFVATYSWRHALAGRSEVAVVGVQVGKVLTFIVVSAPPGSQLQPAVVEGIARKQADRIRSVLAASAAAPS